MTVLVLCNVGDRDVKVRDRVVAEQLGIELWPGEAPWTVRGARQGGQQLREHPEMVDSLAFDILDPCLDYVLDRHRQHVDRLVLFGTDQPEGLVAEYHRQKDTLYFAEVMARHYQGQAALRIQQAEAQQVRGIDAAMYDEAFEAYGRLLAGLPQEVEACYLVITGGMPACNAALLLQGVRRWGQRARVLYLPEGKTEPRELRAGEQILTSFQQAVAQAHLDRQDFAAARALMTLTGAPRALCGLAVYGQQRLDFDFDTAQATLLDEAERYGDMEARRFVDEVRHDLDALREGANSTERLRALLAELFWNSEIAFAQHRYADFLGRAYRFQEAVLRFLVETLYGLQTDVGPKAKESTVAAWSEALLTNTSLMTYLTEKGINGWPLTERQINRKSFGLLLSYAQDPKRGKDEEGRPIVPPERLPFLKAQMTRLNAFDKLVALRHRTIIGHGFHGVSLEQVRAAYPNGEKDEAGRPDPVRGMRVLLEALQVPVRDDPYRRLAGFIVDKLRAG